MNDGLWLVLIKFFFSAMRLKVKCKAFFTIFFTWHEILNIVDLFVHAVCVTEVCVAALMHIKMLCYTPDCKKI